MPLLMCTHVLQLNHIHNYMCCRLHFLKISHIFLAPLSIFNTSYSYTFLQYPKNLPTKLSSKKKIISPYIIGATRKKLTYKIILTKKIICAYIISATTNTHTLSYRKLHHNFFPYKFCHRYMQHCPYQLYSKLCNFFQLIFVCATCNVVLPFRALFFHFFPFCFHTCNVQPLTCIPHFFQFFSAAATCNVTPLTFIPHFFSILFCNRNTQRHLSTSYF